MRAVAGPPAATGLPAIAVAPELRGVVRPGVLVFGGLAVRRSPPAGEARAGELAAGEAPAVVAETFRSGGEAPAVVAETFRSGGEAPAVVAETFRSGGEPAGDARRGGGAPGALDPRAEARIALVRAMYRRFGIDPTRTRPSSEALWRRVRRGLPWPRINTLVDAGNRCSCETQLPFGLYDLDRVAGRVELRAGAAGDQYPGIGKPVVHLAGRPALFDARGPFGNPTSDSARTMITTSTRRALVVVFAPPAVPHAELEAVLDLTAARVGEAAGGAEEGRWIAPCA